MLHWIMGGKMLYCVVLRLKHALSVPPKRTAFTTCEVNVAMTSYKSKLWSRLTEACYRRTCSKTSIRTRCVLETLAKNHKTYLVTEWYKLGRAARSCPLVSRVRISSPIFCFQRNLLHAKLGLSRGKKVGSTLFHGLFKLKKYLPIPNL